MKSQSRNQLKFGSVLGYVQMFLSVLVQLLYTPIMIRTLGRSEYGLYNTVASTISMLSILSLGFNSSYIRYYSKYKKKNDQVSIDRLNGLFLGIFLLIGLVALCCGLYLSSNLNVVFGDGLTTSELGIAKILMILLTINLAISFPMSVFQNIISAHERFIVLKLLAIGKTVVSPLVSLPLLLSGYGSIALVTVTVTVNLAIDLCYFYYVMIVLKNKFSFKPLKDKIFISLLTYTSFIAINMIIDQINWSVDKMLLGRFRGTTSVAIYSVGFTIYHFYQTLSTSVSGVFAPRIHRICNKDISQECKDNELTTLFVKVGRIQYLILLFAATGFIFFGKVFVLFWAGKGYESAYYVAVLLMLPATVALTQNVGIEVQRALNKHQFRSIAYACMALINLILSIHLCKVYGEVGAAMGTAISLVLANGITMNIYYYKKCGINIPLFWKNIISISVKFVPVYLFGVLYSHFLLKDNLVSFGIGAIIYSVVYCSIAWFFVLNEFEKGIITGVTKKVFKAKKRRG